MSHVFLAAVALLPVLTGCPAKPALYTEAQVEEINSRVSDCLEWNMKVSDDGYTLIEWPGAYCAFNERYRLTKDGISKERYGEAVADCLRTTDLKGKALEDTIRCVRRDLLDPLESQ